MNLDTFEQDVNPKILERGRAPLTDRAGALVVADRMALAGGQDRALLAHAYRLSVLRRLSVDEGVSLEPFW